MVAAYRKPHGSAILKSMRISTRRWSISESFPITKSEFSKEDSRGLINQECHNYRRKHGAPNPLIQWRCGYSSRSTCSSWWRRTKRLDSLQWLLWHRWHKLNRVWWWWWWCAGDVDRAILDGAEKDERREWVMRFINEPDNDNNYYKIRFYPSLWTRAFVQEDVERISTLL